MSGWDSAERWYNDCVGEKGHYYHQSLVIPNVLRLFDLSSTPSSLLDLGCGQGVLARHLPHRLHYTGIDLSQKLIASAQQLTKRPNVSFITADATQHLPLEKNDFDLACFVLSLQNMEHQEQGIANASRHLKEKGKLVLVLNHPCFRIPRQSEWGIDEKSKIQYRRINRYLTPMTIPLQIHPSKGALSECTYSFHHPLSQYVQWLARCQFSVAALEEWCSDKQSEGSKALMEDRARREIPLFLAIVAILSKKLDD